MQGHGWHLCIHEWKILEAELIMRTPIARIMITPSNIKEGTQVTADPKVALFEVFNE